MSKQADAFKESVIGALRTLADGIEAGTYAPLDIRHGQDSLAVTYRWTDDEEKAQAARDPKRPCACTSRPIDAGDGELACPDCGETWTP